QNPTTLPLSMQPELSTPLAISVYTSCPMVMCILWMHLYFLTTTLRCKNDLSQHGDGIAFCRQSEHSEHSIKAGG
ncbi:hypothetical protein V8D89_006324, partial [Ganoderma adspersum]